MPFVFAFMVFLGAVVYNDANRDGPDSGHQGKFHSTFGLHHVCVRWLDGRYEGRVHVGGTGKESSGSALVPYCAVGEGGNG